MSLIAYKELVFGKYSSFLMQKTPKRVLQLLSYYKFAAQFIPKNSSILEIGCNEGLGTALLCKDAKFVKGVDFDKKAIESAKKLWDIPNLEFIEADFRDIKVEKFDVVCLFDVIEHIFPENFPAFFDCLLQFVQPNGILIMGTPSLEQQKYASLVARQGHVNCMTGDTLYEWLNKAFHHSFVFCGNDEVVHTGFYPMANYLLGIGCIKK